jgi:photosystem II stability/assembly factor-like uncharacterized protein
MNKVIIPLSLFLIFYQNTFCQNAWEWLNPQPEGYDCLKIIFTDRQNGFILNADGDLIRTNDQGQHWQVSRHFPNANLLEIADSTGVITTNTGVLYLSADNGESWQTVQTGIRAVFESANIVSRDTFFLSTQPGIIYETVDRGKTWITLDCKNQINCTYFINSKTGFAGGPQSVILKTTDGGLSWQKKLGVSYIPSGIASLQFLSADTGYAFRAFRDLLITYDGGNTWDSNNATASLPVMDFVNSTVGYLAGDIGEIMRTDDGGKTWNSVTPPNEARDGNQIYSLHFFSADTGFAVGMLGRILKTIDGGRNWNAFSPTYIPITSVEFPTAGTGYASTWNNVYKTTDKGKSWNQLNLTTGTAYGSSSRFSQVHFTSADSGFFLSTNYAEEHQTTDGGITWTTTSPFPKFVDGSSYDALPGISFLDKKTGFLSLEETQACCSGILLETRDGGNVWNTLWSSITSGAFFSKIFYTDSITGYAVRAYQLFKTTDASQSWTPIFMTNYGYMISELCFVNPQTGFLADDQGELYVTHDAGNNWQLVDFPRNIVSRINVIRFFNDQIGYLSDGNEYGPGNYGNIYKTIDGGQTWQYSKNIGGMSIVFTPDSNVVVSSFGGTIIKNLVRNWQVDSINILPDNYCGQIISASVGAALSEMDSIYFLVTAPDGSTQYISSSQGFVKNGRSSIRAKINNLIPGLTYIVKIRFQYDGIVQYSDSVAIMVLGIPKPSIQVSGNDLISSSSYGNQWFKNGVVIPMANQNRYTVQVAGYYSVQVNQDSCTSQMSDSVFIPSSCLFGNPIPIPVIRDSAQILISSSPDGNQWYINGSAISTANQQYYIPVISGLYTVQVSHDSCKSIMSQPLSITIANSVPCSNGNAVPTPVIRDSLQVLISSARSGNQWFLNNILIPGANGQQYVPVSTGSYTVQVTLDSCKSLFSNPINFTATTNKTGIGFYPNPAKEELFIENYESRPLDAEIINIYGIQLYTGSSSAQKIRIDIGSFSAGQYILRIRDRQTSKQFNIQFLKQ